MGVTSARTEGAGGTRDRAGFLTAGNARFLDLGAGHTDVFHL